mmetsp:Transcript_40275/g.108040  ORF Transcript_40275/g.108040 Transcript_40275/m.108040 type:complete len:83 (-) Transcript_40275:62-310(-)
MRAKTLVVPACSIFFEHCSPVQYIFSLENSHLSLQQRRQPLWHPGKGSLRAYFTFPCHECARRFFHAISIHRGRGDVGNGLV